MSRNRKHQTAAVRFGPALRALSLCVFLGGAGIGYVWQKEQINTLADRLKQSEIRYQQLRGQNDRLAGVLASMQTLSEIKARIKQMELGLVEPQPDQIVRLAETLPGAEMAGTRDDLFCAAEPEPDWPRR